MVSEHRFSERRRRERFSRKLRHAAIVLLVSSFILVPTVISVFVANPQEVAAAAEEDDLASYSILGYARNLAAFCADNGELAAILKQYPRYAYIVLYDAGVDIPAYLEKYPEMEPIVMYPDRVFEPGITYTVKPSDTEAAPTP